MITLETHDLRAHDFEEHARQFSSAAPLRRARHLELLARFFAAGSAWTERRARSYARRSTRTIRTAVL